MVLCHSRFERTNLSYAAGAVLRLVLSHQRCESAVCGGRESSGFPGDVYLQRSCRHVHNPSVGCVAGLRLEPTDPEAQLIR